MTTRRERIQQLHLEALQAAKKFFESEAGLLDVLQKMEAEKGYFEFQCTSLFMYAVQELKLSESTALNMINVARKSIQVPALKQEIQNGNLSVSKARKIVSVLTPENQSDWIEKAKTMSSRNLEREVTKVSPQADQPERIRFITESRVHLSLSLEEKILEVLKRAQDLESQRQRRAVSLEETLDIVGHFYLDKNDPQEAAKRAALRAQKKTGDKKSDVTGQVKAQAQLIKRKPLPTQLEHQVHLRDGSQCTYYDSKGRRCGQRRWLHIHHLNPISQGGQDTLENIVILCSGHHSIIHAMTHAAMNAQYSRPA